MKKILILLAGVLFFGCQSEERFIDNSKIMMKLYVADSLNNDVSIYEFPAMELQLANILESNNIELASPVGNIREFQEKIYIFAPEEDKMIVFDAEEDTVIAVVDFPENSKPFDISFANPADGFVIFKNSPTTANFDLVFNKIAKYIDSESTFSSVSDFGSFSYFMAKDTTLVSVLDNRVYSFEGSIELQGKPVLSSVTSAGELLVISEYDTTLGEETPVVNPARYYLINLENNTVRHSNELGDVVINSKEIVATDIVTTPLGYAFVTTNKGLIRLDTEKNGLLFDVNKAIFDKIEYNTQLKNLILLQNKNGVMYLSQANSSNGIVVNSYELPPFANSFHLSN